MKQQIKLKLKPMTSDFEAMPEIDFEGKLNNPVTYINSFDEIVQGLRNPDLRRKMGEELMREIFVRAYNYTAMMFAGYNRLSYICMMYAEEVKKTVGRMVLDEEYVRTFLIGLKVCGMDGKGPLAIKEPYLIVGADMADKAVQKYHEAVPLTAYFTPHVIACQENGGDWQLLSELVTESDMKKMLEEARRQV